MKNVTKPSFLLLTSGGKWFLSSFPTFLLPSSLLPGKTLPFFLPHVPPSYFLTSGENASPLFLPHVPPSYFITSGENSSFLPSPCSSFLLHNFRGNSLFPGETLPFFLPHVPPSGSVTFFKRSVFIRKKIYTVLTI